jgi:glucokinase
MAQRLIGVDVGGTKVSVAVLENGRLGDPKIRPTDLSSSQALVDQLASVIQAEGSAGAVGIGLPSVIDFATGTARSSVNIPLQGVPLRHLLTERLGFPTFVENDATVAALAEAHDDQMRPIADIVVMFTVGTGVGGGIVIGGRIFRGATGAAPELGHTIVAANLEHGAPAADGFPHPASLEHHAAGRALDRLGLEHGIGEGYAVVAAARSGNPEAQDALRIVGESLGVGIANAINTFDPDLVVVGGGVSTAGELLLGPAREAAQRFVVRGVGTKTEIRLARYGPQAGVRGATLLAGQELEVTR